MILRKSSEGNWREVVVRLDDGEEILTSLKAVAKKEGILAASVIGIGAVRKAELAHYNTEKKQYHSKKFEGRFELLSLTGNITMLDGEPTVHLHAVICSNDFLAYGGHVISSEVNPTCEIILFPLDTKIERKHDSKTGLNLQKF